MAINQNHLFEELNGVKCAIVEKNVSSERVQFLKELLEVNQYDVVVVPSPPPKASVSVAEEETEITPAFPETFTVGVSDYTFNPINAIFGRLLKTREGHIVTKDFWEQKSKISLDDVPYFHQTMG